MAYRPGSCQAVHNLMGVRSKTGRFRASAIYASSGKSTRTSKYRLATGTLFTYFRSTGAASCMAISRIASVSVFPFRESVTFPAALALWTQLTTPKGATNQRWPSSSTSTTGVFLFSPLFRPMVVSTYNTHGHKLRFPPSKKAQLVTECGIVSLWRHVQGDKCLCKPIGNMASCVYFKFFSHFLLSCID
jgi:hypothetical protein